MMHDPDSDLELRLGELLRAEVDQAVSPTDVVAVVSWSSRGAEANGRRGRSTLLPFAATALVAAAATGIGLAQLGGGMPSAAPSVSEISSASPPSNASAEPTTVPSPTPFDGSAWFLVDVELRPALAEHVVQGISPDGNIVLVIEPPDGPSVHLIVSGENARDLRPPNHDEGAPMGAELSPDGSFVLITQLGQAWRYDVALMEWATIPNPPGTGGGSFWVADSQHLLVLSGQIASTELGGVTNTELWRLDLETLVYARLGSRDDGIFVYPAADGGAVVLSDTSENQDNSGWVFYRIFPDGSELLLYDYGATNPAPSAWAVAPDGDSIAFSIDGQLRLFDAAGGTVRDLGIGFPRDFSPDSLQIQVARLDGTIVAIDRDGTTVTSLSGSASGWIRVQ